LYFALKSGSVSTLVAASSGALKRSRSRAVVSELPVAGIAVHMLRMVMRATTAHELARRQGARINASKTAWALRRGSADDTLYGGRSNDLLSAGPATTFSSAARVSRMLARTIGSITIFSLSLCVGVSGAHSHLSE
jgi:hypothetical protein